MIIFKNGKREMFCDVCKKVKTKPVDTMGPSALRKAGETAGWSYRDGLDVCPECTNLKGMEGVAVIA